MDPEGILNAWTTNVRIIRARSMAKKIASMFSRRADLPFPAFRFDTFDFTIVKVGLLGR
jgi:hypothetical protein